MQDFAENKVDSGVSRKKVWWISIISVFVVILGVLIYVIFFSSAGADTNQRSAEFNRTACLKKIPFPGGDYQNFITWCQNNENNFYQNQSCSVQGGANPEDQSKRSWICVADQAIVPETNSPDAVAPIAGEIPPQQQDQTPTSPTTTPETTCNAKSTSSVTWHYDPVTGSCTIVPANSKAPATAETPYEKFVRECQSKGTGYFFSGDPKDSNTWQCLKDTTVANKKPCGGDTERLNKCKEVCKSKNMVCAENEFCGCRKPATPKEKLLDLWQKIKKSLGITFT